MASLHGVDAFFEHHPIAHLLIDVDEARLVAANQAATRRYGQTREQLLGKTLLELVLPEERDQLRRFLAAPADGGTPRPAWTELRSDGGTRSAELNVVPIALPNPGHLLLAVSDAAPRGQPDGDVVRARDHLRRILDAVPDLWFVMDAEGRYEEVSDPQHPSLAGAWDAARGRRFAEVVTPELARLAEEALQRARTHHRVERIEYSLPVKNGRMRRFEGRIAPMSDRRWLYLARDVTDAYEAQEALRESEARYARAVRGTADGIWEWDVLGGSNYLSPRWKQLLGYENGELPDNESSFFGRLHPDDVGRCRAAIAAHFEQGAPYDIDLRLRTRDGAYRWFRSRGVAERDAQGRPFRMSGSITDITAQRQAEQAMRDSETKLSAVFEVAPVGLSLTCFDDGVLHAANEEISRILGRPRDQILGRRVIDMGGWPDAAARADAMAELRARGQAERYGVAVRRPDGSTVQVLARMQSVELGGRVFVLSALTDLTDRLAAERALRESEARFSAMFQIVPVGITLAPLEGGGLLAINDEGCRIAGRTREEMLGRSSVEFGLWASAEERQRAIAPLYAGQRMSRDDVAVHRPDGSVLHVSTTSAPIEVGGTPAMVTVFVDLSDQIAARRLLEERSAQDRQHRDELSALTYQLMMQEQRGSQRLAQLLHDRLGQTLTALRMAIERSVRLEGSSTSNGSHALIDQAVTEMRQVLCELRPPLLEEQGLFAALDNELASPIYARADCDVMLDVPDALQAQRWPGDVEYALFMIAREALGNSLRHARARLIRVALEGDACQVCLEVGDDGVGFADRNPVSPPGHLGLIGMRERARSIGASLTFGDGPDGGASVVVHWGIPA